MKQTMVQNRCQQHIAPFFKDISATGSMSLGCNSYKYNHQSFRKIEQSLIFFFK